ncbi:hypothetical protein [Streptomyces jumonjinensis]|uniref:Uncharacterized protein n=1 Tax=Streptomyces jumonjinensis TaxID=1945 RepID=A0A646KPW9_STRJU|nr:hypothetical protein [Streptomyces jumonjinensis]MQT04107.1 hypothetical protein [Streptomyces jumonjinensis]
MAVRGWEGALREAREATGFGGEVTDRTVGAVRAVVRGDRRSEFERELGALGGGGAFEAFLDHWWTQVLADAAGDEQARERAVEFADLAIALRVRAEGGPTHTAAEVERMIMGPVS